MVIRVQYGTICNELTLQSPSPTWNVSGNSKNNVVYLH